MKREYKAPDIKIPDCMPTDHEENSHSFEEINPINSPLLFIYSIQNYLPLVYSSALNSYIHPG